MSQTLIKFAGRDLVTLLPRLNLPPATAEAVRNGVPVPDALALLEADGFLLPAARLIAFALPRREAVWWACMCALHTAPPDLPSPDRLAREAAENWVRQQTDAQRRTAMEHAETNDFASPEAWAAVAAFWSGESMAPAGQPAVPPPPHLTGTAVAGAVALAATRGDVLRQKARLLRFLESGRNIAAGGVGRLAAEEP
jgi:hypothetical protein